MLFRSLTVAPPCSLTQTPHIASVVNGGSFLPAISPNGMITIQGSGFQAAGQTYIAGAADFVNSAFPPWLSCVAVEVGGMRVPITFTSAGQINAQAPASMQSGSVPVQAILNPGTANAVFSNVFTAQAQDLAPAFFTFDGKSIAARNALTAAIVADPSLGIPGSVTLKPGDYVSLFAMGFGATDPVVLEGQVDAGLASVVAAFTVSIGGVTVPASGVLYGGLSPGSISGLYQFNVQVPASLADGNQPVVIAISGQTTQSGTTVAVKH